MSPHPDRRRVAVVGAGFAGLAAAGALGARGHAVTLFEASADAGGKARRVEAAGALVDVGPTLLADARPLEALDALAPADAPLASGLRRVNPGLVATFPGGRRLALWADPARLEASVAGLGPDALADWRRVLDLGARAARLAERFYARGDVTGPVDIVRFLAPGGASPTDVAPFLRHRSLRDLVGGAVRTAELRRLLCHTARFLGLDAAQAPAVALVIPYLLATRGVLHPTGGFSGLAGRLLDLAAKRGTAFRAGEAIAGVELRGGRVRTLRLAGGERVTVDGVIAAVDPAVVARWLPGSKLAARLTRLGPTLGARVAWWVVEGGVPDATPHALHFPEDPGLEPLYVTVPTAIEPALAPPGTSIVYALVHGPAGESATSAWAEALRARVVAAGQWPAGRVLAAGVAGGGAACYGYSVGPGLSGAFRYHSARLGSPTCGWPAAGCSRVRASPTSFARASGPPPWPTPRWQGDRGDPGAPPSAAMGRFLDVYVSRYLRRHFHRVRLRGTLPARGCPATGLSSSS